ncbi:hypothetical protein VIGAN_02192000 [Vigna angularis var. angularis]|uniref:Uncharacterized protein n=1 Tax=Vigna angularis var. angularis TaxID=157739 RepID=A0A0S3RFB7_PHAAN|nr:hypothetical protein VIGAN_02192000 [Vigna angularis var. angularis]
MVFHLGLVYELQKKEMGKSIGSKGLSMDQNRVGSSGSRGSTTKCLYHFQTCVSIKNHQKESSQDMCNQSRDISHTRKIIKWLKSHTGNMVTINSTLKHHDHLPSKEKQGIQQIRVSMK